MVLLSIKGAMSRVGITLEKSTETSVALVPGLEMTVFM
jgi:hypothetical protein